MQPPVSKRKLSPQDNVSEDENTRLRDENARLRDENARLKQELARAEDLAETRLATMIGYNTVRNNTDRGTQTGLATSFAYKAQR